MSYHPLCQERLDSRRLRKPLPAALEFSKAPFEKLGDHVEALGGLCHPWKPESKRMINYLATPACVDPPQFDLVRDYLQQIAQAVKRLVHMTKYSHPTTYVAETVRRIYGDDKRWRWGSGGPMGNRRGSHLRGSACAIRKPRRSNLPQLGHLGPRSSGRPMAAPCIGRRPDDVNRRSWCGSVRP